MEDLFKEIFGTAEISLKLKAVVSHYGEFMDGAMTNNV